MIGTMRMVAALTAVTLTTLVLAPFQWFFVKTGLCRGRPLLRLWHRVAVRALGLRIIVHGSLADQKPLMLAANHVSWADITVLGAVADVSFIARSDMAGWPVVGWFAKMQRSVFVERNRRNRSAAQADEIASRLADGDVMVLFAEGTTGDGNHVLPFNSTLFGAAALLHVAEKREAAFGNTICKIKKMKARRDRDLLRCARNGDAHGEMWVQPVSIAYTRLHGMPMGRQHRPVAAWIGDEDLAPHLAAMLREGAIDVEVRFGEPQVFHQGGDRKAMTRAIEQAVRRMFQDSLRGAAS